MKPFIVIALSIACGALAACSREQKVSAAGNPGAEQVIAPDTFVVDKPEQFPLVAAAVRKVHDDITANGIVAPDINRTATVNSLSGGRVIELNARLGDEVRKGQLLLRILSSDLAGAFADYQKALADESLARRARDRSKELYDHGAAALKDAEQAESAEQKALVDVKAAAERIRILGGNVEHPSPEVAIYAPASGTIVEQNVTPSAGVKSLDNAPNLFTIADLSRVWILCDVYEDNLSQVRPGDIAEVRMNAYPDRPLHGRISNVSRVLDPATRTAKVRVEVDNSAGTLRPGMFATARFYSQGLRTRVTLPQTAILRLHDKDWVFRSAGGNRFRRDEIKTGETTPDGQQFVLAGIAPGDQVVKNALQLSSTVEK